MFLSAQGWCRHSCPQDWLLNSHHQSYPALRKKRYQCSVATPASCANTNFRLEKCWDWGFSLGLAGSLLLHFHFLPSLFLILGTPQCPFLCWSRLFSPPVHLRVTQAVKSFFCRLDRELCSQSSLIRAENCLVHVDFYSKLIPKVFSSIFHGIK